MFTVQPGGGGGGGELYHQSMNGVKCGHVTIPTQCFEEPGQCPMSLYT